MAIQVPAELVELARRGEPAGIERLVETIWPDAYRLAYAILGDRSSAEDAAQEACVIVYRTIATLRSTEAFRVWLYRIVVREASAVKRTRVDVPAATGATEARFDRSDSVDIWRALDRLAPHLRDVVVLRYFEDLSSSQIAAVLAIPSGTVRFRLMTAKRKLRPLLDDTSDFSITTPSEVRTHAV